MGDQEGGDDLDSTVVVGPPTSNNQQQCETSEDEDIFFDATNLVSQGFDFNLDYLENKGSGMSEKVLRKQSLYMKFDPLVSSDSPQKLGRKSDIMSFGDKMPLTKVSPTLRGMETQPQQQDLLTGDLTFAYTTQQQQDDNELDNTLEDSSGCKVGESPTPQPAGIVDNIGIVDVLKYSDADMERVRAEIRKEMEEKVELEKKDLMQQMASLQEEIRSLRQQQSSTLKQHLDEKEGLQLELKQFRCLLEGYCELIEEVEGQLETQRKRTEYVKKGRDQLNTKLEDFQKVYYELLQRSEQTKIVLANFKENETKLKVAVDAAKKAYQEAMGNHLEENRIYETQLQRLTAEAQTKDQETKKQEASLKAHIKFLEKQSSRLQVEIEHKTKENQELSSICEEFIKAQGGSS